MSKCVFCLVDYNCMIILLSVTVFVCHDKGNGFFCTINSPVYVYWKQEKSIHLTPLLKLQNKIRIDKDKLFYNTGILPFNVLVKHRIGLLMHKLSNGNVPKPLHNLYQCNKNIHHHFTRQTDHFHSMRGNTEFIY